MTSPLYTKLVAVQMVPESWEQFKKLARSQGLTSSSLLRQMVARELRRAARKAFVSPKPTTPTRVFSSTSAKLRTGAVSTLVTKSALI